MATCPRCLGPLTENHRCPGAALRRIFYALSVITGGVLVGGLSAWIVTDRPAPALVLAASALGAVLAKAMSDAVRRKW